MSINLSNLLTNINDAFTDTKLINYTFSSTLVVSLLVVLCIMLFLVIFDVDIVRGSIYSYITTFVLLTIFKGVHLKNLKGGGDSVVEGLLKPKYGQGELSMPNIPTGSEILSNSMIEKTISYEGGGKEESSHSKDEAMRALKALKNLF